MKDLTIYHNPRCSKSRQTLNLLTDRGFQPKIVLYLETNPNADEIAGLLTRLGINARALLRKGENAYREKNLDDPNLSGQEIIRAMAESPELMERPVVVRGDKAVLGRPPENVLELI